MSKKYYPYEVRFTKNFTRGSLKGLSLNDTLGVVSRSEGYAALENFRNNEKRNGWELGEGAKVVFSSEL